MAGQTGADALFLVVKVNKLDQELAKEIIAVKTSMTVKIVINMTVLILGRAGVNVLFHAVKVLKGAPGLVKEIIVMQISTIVKVVINKTV